MAIVHRHADAFDDRNAFLQVLLGVVSHCSQAADLVLAFGPGVAGDAPASAELAPVLDAVLGAAALASSVVGALETERDRTSVPSPSEATSPRALVVLRGLLV